MHDVLIVRCFQLDAAGDCGPTPSNQVLWHLLPLPMAKTMGLRLSNETCHVSSEVYTCVAEGTTLNADGFDLAL